MSKNTPGPWTAKLVEDGGYDCMTDAWHITSQSLQSVCMVDLGSYGQKPRHREGTYQEAKADALLIAAAPDLLAALYIAAEALDNYSDVNDGDDGRPVANRAMSALSDVKAAIAKAEGK